MSNKANFVKNFNSPPRQSYQGATEDLEMVKQNLTLDDKLEETI